MTLLDKINQVAEELKFQYGTAESVPDWAIAEKLNEPIVTTKAVYQSVKTRDIKTILILSQELFNIVDGVSNGGSKVIKSLCFSAITVLNESELKELDFNNPEYLSSFQEIVVSLFEAGLISEMTKERLESLIVPEIQQVFGESWAQLNQLEVNDRIVGLARGGLG
ncbi:MAG: hypothetical protein IM550_20310 [Microcystis sp. M54BS1]|uniref:hypothetical protein n=1 Tax=unclassified Microcystis TaxID=2643300 RepID=UPI00257E17CE|nr:MULTISPECIES: hypothetical protein [unclassified Microcystis]MCA2541471.1 hypothetical protein [Microcystis sp. M54BS1]MCA2594919.1 hypothetical protein [Microcystis sp. M38BS1]MCA2611880.1 hypothetical protein [Microcystis sp. M27BS1]MCA2505416.1 hypothetical protein [Microcystis sp. M62BS1]MCA2509203.1 hypothetical protein [Microcystis sp. M60BS1]